MSLASFLKILKEESSAQLWSTAVSLARRNVFHVHNHSKTPGHFAVRVLDTGHGLNPELELFLEDEDWTCDCVSDEDPCVHVVAATIAIKRNIDHNLPLPRFKNELRKVRYEWRDVDGAIRLRRWIAKVDEEGRELEREELKVPLLSLVAGLKSQAEFAPSKIDLNIDRILEDMKQVGAGVKLRHSLMKLMEELDEDCYVQRSLRSKAQFKGYIVTLYPESGGLRLKSKLDPAIQVQYKNGFCASSSHLFLSPDSDTRDFIHSFLDPGRFFTGETTAELKSRIIPLIEKWYEVKGEAENRAEYQKPHIRFHSEETESGIRITPRIFYGVPPVAYIEADRVQLLTADSPVPLRDYDAERRLRDDLWHEKRVTLNDAMELSSFADFKNMGTLHSHEVYGSDLSSYKVRGSLTPHVNQGKDWSLDFVSPNLKQGSISYQEVLQSYERGDSLLKVPGEGIFELPVKWISEHLHLLQDLSSAQNSNSATKTMTMNWIAASLGSENFAQDALSFADSDAIEQSLKSLNLQAELREYQKFGIRWLLRLRSAGLGAMLADDMGLGKTLQSISILEPDSLVVCPTSLIDNWKMEIAKFRPGLSVKLYHGTERNLEVTKGKVVITTYGVLRRDVKELSKRQWKSVILDESQNIKNSQSQLFKAIVQLQADFRLALSGTPIENRIEDLWSQMHFLNPGFFGPLKSFKKTYAPQQLEKFADRSDYLKKKLSSVLLRRMKSEVATDLPPKSEVSRLLHMSEKEGELYQSYLAMARKEVLGELNETANVTSILNIILRLRQICCDPGLVHSDLDTIPPTKLRYLKRSLNKALETGHKVVIISQWTAYLDRLQTGLSGFKDLALRIDGKSDNRQSIVDRFQNDSDIKLLFLSLKAGGIGLNLTAADYVFSMDPWWNPAVEAQAHDRVYRIGQTKPVFVERLIMKDTIEERILDLQKRKLNLSFDLIDAAASPSLELTREDLISLLN